MNEKSKKINKKSQLICIGIPIVLLVVTSIIFSSNFEAYSQMRLIVIALFGGILFIITLFTNSQFILKVIDYAKVVFITLCLFAIITTYFILPTVTDGTSMEDTIHDGDILLCTYPDNYQVGDIVVVYLKEQDIELCKRIIGVSGDNVYFYNNEYYLNNRKIAEPYVSKNNNQLDNDFDLNDKNICAVDGFALDCSAGIPNNYYLVLGDNRDVSADSRSYGLFYKDDILAKVVFDVNQFKRLD